MAVGAGDTTDDGRGAQDGGQRRLDYVHYRAMELRLAGWSYSDIAAELGYSAQTIRKWFWSDEDFRREWRAIQEERIARARAMLVEVAPVAAQTIASLSRQAKNERVRLSAAQDVLDRVMGRAPERHEHSGVGGGPITTAILSKDEVDRRLRDLGFDA